MKFLVYGVAGAVGLHTAFANVARFVTKLSLNICNTHLSSASGKI